MNNYSVYMHLFPNGKKYIGITSTKPELRWGHKGNGYKGQPKMQNAIAKYGWDNIEHKILFAELSKEEAEKKEIELIKENKCTDIRYGYNTDNGGNTVGSIGAETIEKIRQANLGKKKTEEQRKKISDALKEYVKTEEHCKNISKSKKGKSLTEEHKKKVSESLKGRVLDAKARENISKAKRGSLNPNYNKTPSEETIKKQQVSRGTQQVIQRDGESNIINIWDSIRTASKETGICKKNIYRSCKSDYLKAGGYKWEYAS